MKKSNDITGVPEISVSHRLRVVQELLKIRSVAAFANEIGVDTSVLNNIMSPYGRMGKPSFDTLQKIALKFPRINMDWLITGKGEPLRPFSEHAASILPAQCSEQIAADGDTPENAAIKSEKKEPQPELNVPVLISELRVCQAEKENLERILALKDELIAMLRLQLAT